MDMEQLKDKLKKEIEKFKHEYTNVLPQQIAEARDHGDLKENVEYHASRERMGMVKGKIARLSEQLARLNSIDLKEISEDCIGFGSNVVLKDVASDEFREYFFVSEGEIDPANGKITLATPFGRALTGKKIGEEVDVVIPAGKFRFVIQYICTIHGHEFGEKKASSKT